MLEKKKWEMTWHRLSLFEIRNFTGFDYGSICNPPTVPHFLRFTQLLSFYQNIRFFQQLLPVLTAFREVLFHLIFLFPLYVFELWLNSYSWNINKNLTQMGNQLAGTVPTQILPVEHYLQELPEFEYDSRYIAFIFLKKLILCLAICFHVIFLFAW